MTTVTDDLDALVGTVDGLLTAEEPHPAGDVNWRPQPVHTAYVPADKVDASTPRTWGAQALELVDRHAPDDVDLSAVFDLSRPLAERVGPRLRAKLGHQPVEDLRVDFEDSYRAVGDRAEDDDARRVGRLLDRLAGDEHGPGLAGIRVKSLEHGAQRVAATLDLVLGAMTSRLGRARFVVTLPKVTSVAQVEAMRTLCAGLESRHRLDDRTLRFEIQVETPQTLLAEDGSVPLPAMVRASGGRCVGLHFGTYDYSAALGIVAAHQSLDHPAADHAKAVMQLAAARLGVRLSDGSSNVLPTGDRSAVLDAWRLHAGLVRRSLVRGFVQGWDLHPGQLVSRYTAVYAFYGELYPDSCHRLTRYLLGLESGTLDEPATAQALAAFLLRGLDCGALDDDEVAADTGLKRAALESLALRRTPR